MKISQNLLSFILIVVDVLLVISVLLQQKEGGLSTVFGGEGTVFRAKRGLARGLHWMTVVLAVIFIGLSVVVLFIKK